MWLRLVKAAFDYVWYTYSQQHYAASTAGVISYLLDKKYLGQYKVSLI